MRSTTDINVIKSRISNPFCIENFLSKEDITHLIDIFNQHQAGGVRAYEGLVEKITGPVTLNLETYLSDPVIIKIMSQLEKEIGKFEMTAGFFFRTDFPHIIHNDDTHELPSGVYKGITLLNFSKAAEISLHTITNRFTIMNMSTVYLMFRS